MVVNKRSIDRFSIRFSRTVIMFTWVCSGSSSFLPPSENIPVVGLAPGRTVPFRWTRIPSRVYSHLMPDLWIHHHHDQDEAYPLA